jgi:hypothetical protein
MKRSSKPHRNVSEEIAGVAAALYEYFTVE